MLDGKLLIFFHGFMSCICKFVFLNHSEPSSVSFCWDWWIWRGTESHGWSDVSCVCDLGCTILPQLHGPFASCACSWPPPHGCVRILSSTKEFRRGFNSPFGEPYTARSCRLCEVHGKPRFAVHSEGSSRCCCPAPRGSPSPEELECH